MSVSSKIQELKNQLPEHCTLVAVSKTKPNEMILDGYSSGHRDFGENKVQELVSKYEGLPKDIKWHMIGHLQRNKVKYIAPFVYLIHGVDSLRLLQEINKQGAKNDRIIDCLLQVHIAKESTKFGFDLDELDQLLEDGSLNDLKNVHVRGLMGMATHTDNAQLIREEFVGLNATFKRIASDINLENVSMDLLSIGMSNDYEIALACGSNMIRVGSLLFGERSYPN